MNAYDPMTNHGGSTCPHGVAWDQACHAGDCFRGYTGNAASTFPDGRTDSEDPVESAVSGELDYQIVTPHPYGTGIWESDTIGDNPARTIKECREDIACFRAGVCGPDMGHGTYAIQCESTGEIMEKDEA